ncbi:unnamed protein product, partial [Closterium sp. Naga37s-1]
MGAYTHHSPCPSVSFYLCSPSHQIAVCDEGRAMWQVYLDRHDYAMGAYTHPPSRSLPFSLCQLSNPDCCL